MEVAIRSRPKPGETANGDAAVEIRRGGRVLVAVIDGLGHGPGAEKVARSAVAILEKCVGDASPAAPDSGTDDGDAVAGSGPEGRSAGPLHLEGILMRIHEGLTNTRGAVCAILDFDTEDRTVTFAGVGNVELHCTNPSIRPFSVGGILGGRWRQPKLFTYRYKDGDLFVLFSDGISTHFHLDEYWGLDSWQIAEAIMASHAKEHDDATVAVVRA